jgi:hypothetical protein
MKTSNYNTLLIMILLISTVTLIGKYAGLRVEYLKSEKQKTEYCNKYNASITDKDFPPCDSIKSSLEEELLHAYNTIDFLNADIDILSNELSEIEYNNHQHE